MVAFADRLERALESAAALGVSRHSPARFEQYLGVLRDAASFTYPRPFPWRGDPGRRALFYEAGSQAQQLADAATIWETTDPEIARKKVKLILDGSALPPTKPDAHDVARNTLLEFATARALAAKGFVVEVTGSEADVCAHYPGLPPFVVECKRPTSSRSFVRNVLRRAPPTSEAV